MQLAYTHTPEPHNSNHGFTIVELLIVVVVIGILAAISLVTYTGIQQNAAAVVLKSDLKQASTQLALHQLENGIYPDDDEDLPRSDGTNFEYTKTGNNYCLTAWSTQAKTSFHISNTTGTVSDGPCDGHVGYAGDDDGGEEDPPLPPTQLAKLLASDGAANDYFGISVAISGDTAIIGMSQDDDIGSNSGSAIIFIRSGGSWLQQAKLIASDGAANDYFGISVDIDGDTAIVGAYRDDDLGANSGSAYIFTRTGGSWSQQAKLTADIPGNAGSDEFGYSVALSGDTAIVGAHQYEPEDRSETGAAYIFTRSGSVWSQQSKLIASDNIGYAHFGNSVAIDGNTAIVGASGHDDMGAAYIFTRSGSNWTEAAQLSTNDGVSYFDSFGNSVAIDGNTAIVGAYWDDDNGTDSGSAYIFTRSGSNWSQATKLTASDGAASDEFGYSVAISGDTAIVGARYDDDNGTDSGSAYIFTRSGSSWSQTAKLTASDGAGGDWFGQAVAISSDTAVIGAYGDDGSGNNSGSAYIFGL